MKNISTNKSTSFHAILHFLNFLKKKKNKFHILLLLEPTSPLTTSKDIDNAVKFFSKKYNSADSLVTIGEVDKFDKNSLFTLSKGYIRFSKKLKKELNNARQNKHKEYFLDGSLYLGKINKILKNKGFISKKTLTYKLEKYKNFEIDDKYDFKIISAIMKMIKNKNE